MSADRCRLTDGRIALCLGLGFLGVYLATLCRVVFWYDSAEYVTAAVTLGIPHPPGYPLYTLIAHVFTWLPIDPALAVNAMSAIFAAAAVALVFLIARQLQCSHAAAAVGAACLGGGRIFWQNALIAEVYCPALAVIALVVLLLLVGRRRASLRWPAAAGFIAGLGLGIHLSIATVGLGLALWVWASGDGETGGLRILVARDRLRARLLRSVAAAGAALVGSMIFLYLPLRAAMQPDLNFGDPSTWDRFFWHITGGNYKNWFRADLDVMERAATIGGFVTDQLSVVGTVLAGLGVVRLARTQCLSCIALLAMAAGNLFFFFDYQVHDLEVFFLPTMLVLSILAAGGAQLLLDAIGRVASRQRGPALARLVSVCLVLFAISLVLGTYRDVDMSDFDDTEEFIARTVDELPDNAVILNFTTPPEWQLDAVFGMYVQKVLRKRLDIEIVSGPTPPQVAGFMQSGRAVYLYAVLPRVARFFELEKYGRLYRLVGPRGEPGRTP